MITLLLDSTTCAEAYFLESFDSAMLLKFENIWLKLTKWLEVLGFYIWRFITCVYR